VDPAYYLRGRNVGLYRYGLAQACDAFGVDLEKLDFEWLLGRYEAGDWSAIARYNLKDTLSSFKLTGKLLGNILMESLAVRETPTRISHTCAPMAYWRKERLASLHDVFPERDFYPARNGMMVNLDDMDITGYKNRLLREAFREEKIPNFRPGIHKVRVVFVPLIAEALRRLSIGYRLQQGKAERLGVGMLERHFPSLYRFADDLDAEGKGGPERKVMAYHSLERQARKPLFDLEKPHYSGYAFEKRYLGRSLSGRGEDVGRDLALSAMETWASGFAGRIRDAGLGVVNMAHGYVFLEGEGDVPEGIFLGEGTFLSYEEGRIAGNIDGETRTFGVDVRLSRGAGIHFERNLLKGVLADPGMTEEGILSAYHQAFEELKEGRVQLPELERKIRAGRDHDTYSKAAWNRLPTRIIKRLGLSEGESVSFVHFPEDVLHLPPTETELDRYFNEIFAWPKAPLRQLLGAAIPSTKNMGPCSLRGIIEHPERAANFLKKLEGEKSGSPEAEQMELFEERDEQGAEWITPIS
jgi:hypothetical protein